MFRVEHRIRPHGGEDRSWLAQTYEVPVTQLAGPGEQHNQPRPLVPIPLPPRRLSKNSSFFAVSPC